MENMLQSILDLNGIKIISKHEQKLIKGSEIQCKENGMCTQYGKQCAELACEEVPSFQIDLI